MKCKFYSEKICKCLFDGPPDDCPFGDHLDSCACFRPIEGEKEPYHFTLKYDKGRPTDKTALTIQNCDRIILKPKSLEVEVKIEKDNFDDFDYIVINGIKFKKV